MLFQTDSMSIISKSELEPLEVPAVIDEEEEVVEELQREEESIVDLEESVLEPVESVCR